MGKAMQEEITGHGYYAVLPMKVLLDESLNPKARLLFAVVANLSNQRGYCFASNSYLAKVTGWHHKTVSGFVSELIKAGYLKRFDEVTSTGVERRLFVIEGASVPHREMAKGVPSNDGGGVAKPRRGVSSNDGGGRSQMTAQNIIRLKVKDCTTVDAEKIKSRGT